MVARSRPCAPSSTSSGRSITWCTRRARSSWPGRAAARTFFEARFWGALTAIQAAQPHLARTGSIVLTSGTAGRRPFPGFTVVSGLCGTMEATVRSLAVELAPIRVNVVTPSLVDTELWAGLTEEARQGLFDMGKKLPVGRIGVLV